MWWLCLFLLAFDTKHDYRADVRLKSNECERCGILSWITIQCSALGLKVLLKQNKLERCAIFSWCMIQCTAVGSKPPLKKNKCERCAAFSWRSIQFATIGLNVRLKMFVFGIRKSETEMTWQYRNITV
jgi:hypothetical protein